MITFKNTGTIDTRAITTMGFSEKSEDAIGFFGTGLKYAIAVILRNGGTVSINTGNEFYEFTTKTVTGKQKEFQIVCMNDRELGFTTELGKQWKVWQAFREIYCNCKDEGGEVSLGFVPCDKEETTVTVDNLPEFAEIYNNIGEYFLVGEPDIKTPYADIYKRPSSGVFYKGVKVKEDMGNSMLTYNIKTNITLTEDRTAKYNHEIHSAVSRCVSSLEDTRLIEKLLRAPELTFEGKLDYGYNYEQPGSSFMEVASRLIKDQCREMNYSSQSYVKKYFTVEDKYEPYDLSPVENQMLKRAQEVLMLAGFEVSRYPIIPVKTLGTGVLATAEGGNVYISRDCFSEGTKTVAHALLEETWHIQHGFYDETREFQTFLFKQVLNMTERLTQEAF